MSNFKASSPAGTWEQFRDDHRECYSSLRTFTRADQRGLCAFCEIKLDPDNEQIAHFHPKSDTTTDYNWALDWANLWLACKGGSQNWLPNYLPPLPENLSCDERKGAKILDGQVFGPHEFPAFPRVFRYEQQPDRIEIHADEKICTDAAIDLSKVQKTIEAFNLNCARLANARLVLHKGLEKAVKILMESGKDPQIGYARLAEIYLSQDHNGHWPQFFTLIRWRFGKFAENYLQSINYEG
ncbi:MAG: TIGR02646 family protein [Anaerolineae bacterium]|nr:TIGR02646 family protein [Anaerolineae bacterium]